MTNLPTKFFGTELRNIHTEADAVAALDYFIRNGNDEDISEACSELEHQEQPVRSVINQLLWKLEYNIESSLLDRCFKLKYASA